MLLSSESESSSFLNARLIEQALHTLKQNIAAHLECETRLERLYLGWQHTWSSQIHQLRMQIEALEARLSPWITDGTEPPRLAVVSQHEDVA